MATKQVKVCDVYGHQKDVRSYTLTLRRVGAEPGDPNPGPYDCSMVAFWDGKSKGTGHSIALAIARSVPVVVKMVG